jgi:hypothetical protein
MHNVLIDAECSRFSDKKSFDRFEKSEIKFIVEQLRIIHCFENEEASNWKQDQG